MNKILFTVSRKVKFYFTFFLFLFSSNIFSQEFHYKDYSVNESNSILLEKKNAIFGAKQAYICKELSTEIYDIGEIDESSSNVETRRTSIAKCKGKFIEVKSPKIIYNSDDKGKLRIEVILFGRVEEFRDHFDFLEIDLYKDEKYNNKHMYDQINYILQDGDPLYLGVSSSKKIYMTVFNKDRKVIDVVYPTPDYIQNKKYNILIEPKYNKIDIQWKVSVADKHSSQGFNSLYFVFSFKPFTYPLNSESAYYTLKLDDFDKALAKWEVDTKNYKVVEKSISIRK